MCINMHRVVIVFSLLLLNIGGILFAQKGADPSQRYFRVIALVHLKGSGGADDPVLPEYVAAGVAAAQAGSAAASARAATISQTQNSPGTQPAAAPAFLKARPGIVAWSMQLSDDKTMAIVHLVAVDHHAFDTILADTRPEILVFEIGKVAKATIESALQQYKKGFSLDGFQVMAQ